jgi:2-oxoglutarate ferredoxin oxidoreductase subunit alpha
MSSGQMLEDVRLAVCGKAPVLLEGRMGGYVPSERAVAEKIAMLLGPPCSRESP